MPLNYHPSCINNPKKSSQEFKCLFKNLQYVIKSTILSENMCMCVNVCLLKTGQARLNQQYKIVSLLYKNSLCFIKEMIFPLKYLQLNQGTA